MMFKTLKEKVTQLVLICSKRTIETQEKGVLKYVYKVNDKDTRGRHWRRSGVCIVLTLNIFHVFF